MEHTKIVDVLKLQEEQEKIVVKGWLKTKRISKNVGFISLNDGTTIDSIQIVMDKDMKDFEELSRKLTIGSSLRVEGRLIKSPGAGQSFEINAKEIEIYGTTDDTFPLQKKELPLEYLRDYSHIRNRTTTFQSVFRIKSKLSFAIHKFFQEKGFEYIHTPIITGSDCEGAGEMFKVTTLDLNNIPKKDIKVDYSQDFFGKETNLTVSGQINLEPFIFSHNEVYTFGPTFRAENSNTTRHVSEFWMIEPEMAFYTIEELMDLEEEFIKYLIDYIKKTCSKELEFLNKRIEPMLIETLDNIRNNSFVRLEYKEAIRILEEVHKEGKVVFEVPPTIDVEIASEHERYLAEKHFKKPIILYNFPKQFKAFYMYQNDDKETVRGTDVLVPQIGEIIGGSEREWRWDILMNRIKELGLSEEDYGWYLDTRRFGTIPHSGFGLGLERLIMLFTGMKNIRDTLAYPRTPKNCKN
jgi:asparaginyl-tRNA synthetase